MIGSGGYGHIIGTTCDTPVMSHIGVEKVGGEGLVTHMTVCVSHMNVWTFHENHMTQSAVKLQTLSTRGGGLGSRPKKMYGEKLGDGVEYHLMKPTPRR